MGPNRVFFPQPALDDWIAAGRAELSDNQLILVEHSRQYRIIEAVLVQREVSGSGDPYELVGRVKSVSFLNELGAELLGTSMVIGENAYDVVAGFLGLPVGRASLSVEANESGSTREPEEALLENYQGREPGR